MTYPPYGFPVAEPDAPAPAPARVRKRRTGLLFSIAAVLGLVGGVGGGYAIQQHREPTPLPSLYVALPVQHGAPASGAALGSAAASGNVTASAATSADASDDDEAKLDGDLRKLLLDKPSGAKDWSSGLWGDGWESMDDFVLDQYPEYQSETFTDLDDDGFRRIAARAWVTSDGYSVTVELIQFRTTDGARKFQPASGTHAFPGTKTGFYYLDAAKGDDGLYVASASLLHGSVVEHVAITSKDRAIPSSMIIDVSKNQWVRL